MNKIKRNIIVASGLIALMYSGLNGCSYCSGSGPTFDIIGLNVSTYKEVYLIEETEYKIELIENDESVDIQDFRLNLEPIAEEGYYVSFNQISNEENHSFTFFQAAYACKQAATPNSNIKEITITSNMDVSDAYPTNTSLNQFFNIVDSYSTNDLDFDYPVQVKNISLKLNNELFSSSSHIFTVKYELTSGDVFEQSSNMVTFN